MTMFERGRVPVAVVVVVVAAGWLFGWRASCSVPLLFGYEKRCQKA